MKATLADMLTILNALQKMLQAIQLFESNAAQINNILERVHPTQAPMVGPEVFEATATISAIITRNYNKLREHLESKTETVNMN